jgi:TRAP transporter 4TM/12TM fusion protein
MENQKKDNSRLQFLHRLLAILIPLTAIFFVLDVPYYIAKVTFFNQQFISIFWSLVLSLLFITIPAKKGMPKNNPQWYDFILVVLTLMVGLYSTIFYPQILMGLGKIKTIEWIFGIIATILVFESVRRTAGLAVVAIIGVFLIYAKFGHLMGGILEISYIKPTRLFQQLYLGADFLLGIPLKVVVEIVFAFVLFGIVYLRVGGGETLMDIAYAIMGTVRGGPAKVAVIASSLFGTISGSAVANVTAVGMITIPLMKKTGYPSYFAGAVEAAAGTGGQIMPPVMGAAAFVMAEFLGVHYYQVVLAAIVPALLYYIALFIQVDLQAIKRGIKGLPKEKVPSLKKVLKEGWMHILPIIILVYTLFYLFWEPGQSAVISTIVAVIISLFNKKTRNIWNKEMVFDMLISSSKSMFEVVAVSGGAGLIVGLVAYTGLGLSFSHMLTLLAGHNLFLLAIITAIASIILGMGMPTTAAYVMLAILAAPAMVNLGVEKMTAHLFVFYFGTLSMLTPPVCLAVFAAGTIAEESSMKVAWQAMKLAVAAYIVPFVFLFNQGVTLFGSFFDVIHDVFTTLMAIVLISFAFEGYFLKKLNMVERILFTVATILLLINVAFYEVSGIILAAVLLTLHIISHMKNKTAETKIAL